MPLKSLSHLLKAFLKGFQNLNQMEVRQSILSHGNFKETYLQIAFPISSARDEDTPALDALSQVLGGGEPSRLVQKVKLEKGLVHSISASSYTPKDPGLFIIGATLPAENVEKGHRGHFGRSESFEDRRGDRRGTPSC